MNLTEIKPQIPKYYLELTEDELKGIIKCIGSMNLDILEDTIGEVTMKVLESFYYDNSCHLEGK